MCALTSNNKTSPRYDRSPLTFQSGQLKVLEEDGTSKNRSLSGSTDGSWDLDGRGGGYTFLGRRICSDLMVVNAAADVTESDVAVITRWSTNVNVS
jgi:hypothetical protein